MAKCVWCRNSTELYKSGYCEDCYNRIRDDIQSNKNRLDELLAQSALRGADKTAILDESTRICKTLESYKKKKVPFYKSDYQPTLAAIYKNFGLHAPVFSARKERLLLFISAASLFLILVIVIVASLPPKTVMTTADYVRVLVTHVAEDNISDGTDPKWSDPDQWIITEKDGLYYVVTTVKIPNANGIYVDYIVTATCEEDAAANNWICKQLAIGDQSII